MKDRVRLKTIISLLIILTLLSTSGFFVFKAYAQSSEDYTSYTKVDPNSRISVTTSRVTWTDLTRNEDAYVYYDKGNDYFDSTFNHNFTLNITSGDVSSSLFSTPWMVANSIDTISGILGNASDDALMLEFFYTGATARLYLNENIGVTSNESGYYQISLNTEYFITIQRNESVGTYGTLYAYIYSDSVRETLLSTLNLTLTEKNDFRYIYAISSVNYSNPNKHSGYIEHLTLNIGSNPTVETLTADNITWNPYIEWFRVTLSGNVTDDGGEDITASFYYRVKETSEWIFTNVFGTYSTGESFNTTLKFLEPLTTYEFLAHGYNSSYTGADNETGWLALSETGSILEFTTNYLSGVAPSMVTWGNPVDPDSENLTLGIYGGVFQDGGDNVTGWFRYRETYPTTGNWTATSNTTGLNTGDDFNKTITGLSLYPQVYEYQAIGKNTYGTGYGGITEWSLQTVTAPNIQTDNATVWSDTKAILRATLLDSGSSDNTCWTTIQYRETGRTVWLTPHVTITSDNTSFLLIQDNLRPDTDYEYRGYAYNFKDMQTKVYGYGDIKTFRTFSTLSIPVLTTGDATYIIDTAVNLSGTLVHDGGSITELGFQFKLKGTSEWVETDKVSTSISPVDFTRILWDLLPDENYQYRAIGHNEQGYGYGSIREFIVNDSGVIEVPQPAPGLDPDAWNWLFDDISENVKSVISLFFLVLTWFFSKKKWHNKYLSTGLCSLVFAIEVWIGMMSIWLSILIAILLGLYIFRQVKK